MNETIKTLQDHRTIRQFKKRALTEAELTAILSAARQTSSYTFLQAASIIQVEDPEKQQAIAKICNQPYVAEAGALFIIIADFYRNKCIAEAQGVDTAVLDTADRFLASFYDATLMTQTMLTAAESLGLGGVILGSINNDSRALIKLLNLPKNTFPVLGLALGEPDQEPQLKPRLPLSITVMKDGYQPLEDPLNALAEYDKEVRTYYDLRNANQRVDAFTLQMARAMANPPAKRSELLEVLQEQGWLKR